MVERFWEVSDGRITAGLAEINEPLLEEYEVVHGDMEPWLPMHRVDDVAQPVLLGGSKIKDFTWTWYSQCIIKDSVLQEFRAHGFTGLDVHPVSAKWKKTRSKKNICNKSCEPDEMQTLWELIPVGWGGVAPEESGMRLIEYNPVDQSGIYSRYTNPAKLVDTSQWDGSDFFIVWPLPAHIFVTDRVAQFIKMSKFKGAALTPLEDLIWPEQIGDTCRPGHLRWYLPEPRANEIGRLLGIY